MRVSSVRLFIRASKFMLNTSLKNRVWGGNDYYFWCFGMDDNYNINSENAEEYFTVTTGEIPVTDNCTFTVEKLNVTGSGLRDQDYALESGDEIFHRYVSRRQCREIR